MVALVGYNKKGNQFIYKINQFELESIDQLELIRLKLPLDGKQIEAVKIVNENTFFITSEDEGGGHAMLYKIKI